MKTFDRYKDALDYSVINPLEVVECKEYHENGRLWDHYFYLNCELHGEYKSYHDSGQRRTHRFYVNGKPHGECKSYWNDGKLSYHCFYVNGLEHGEYKDYFKNGQLCQHYFYVNGEMIDVDHLRDGSYKSLCILSTLFDGNLCNEDI